MLYEMWTTAVYGTKFTGKLALRAVLNRFVCPGSGALVDFAEAAFDFRAGNTWGGCINILGGVAELVSFGLWTTGKDAARKYVKDTLYKLGNKAFGEEIMKEMVDQTVEKVFSASTRITFDRVTQTLEFSLISSGGYEVTKTVSEDLGRMLIEPSFNTFLSGVKQNAKSFSCEFLKKEAEKAAAKEFFKYSSRKFDVDHNFSIVKGALNYYRHNAYNVPSQEREDPLMSLPDHLRHSDIRSRYNFLFPEMIDDGVKCTHRPLLW